MPDESKTASGKKAAKSTETQPEIEAVSAPPKAPKAVPYARSIMVRLLERQKKIDAARK